MRPTRQDNAKYYQGHNHLLRNHSSAMVKANRGEKLKVKRKAIIVIWSIAFVYASYTVGEAESSIANGKIDIDSPIIVTNSLLTSTTLGSKNGNGFVRSAPEEPILIPDVNCTPPAIDDFPRDIYTQEERRKGYLLIHFLASIYVFYCLAVVCDEYFVPSIECICEELQVPSDVAGATFMAIATSSPELFTNVIGTFITEGDIGVGTVVGSAVFNVLGVCACCGLGAKTALPLEWYPLTRDCLFYSIAVCLLIVYLNSRQVFWYEALLQVLLYLFYIFVMYKNAEIRKWAEDLASRNRGLSPGSNSDEHDDDFIEVGRRNVATFVADCGLSASTEERTPLLESPRRELPVMNGNITTSAIEKLDEMLRANGLLTSQAQSEEKEDEWTLTHIPFNQGYLVVLQWLLTWPSRFAFTLTLPNCRDVKWRKLYPLTFLMCIVWIGILSYVAAWLITVIGYTLSIPESVMGLTFLAAGNSVPEIVSSVVVARQGLGTMSISNSIGSNTFDILMCLGLPWLIRGSMIAKNPDKNFVHINSGGLEYSAVALLLSLILFYFILACNKFYLDKKVGALSLILYACFLIFGCSIEMNVFFTVNLPTCKSLYD